MINFVLSGIVSDYLGSCRVIISTTEAPKFFDYTPFGTPVRDSPVVAQTTDINWIGQERASGIDLANSYGEDARNARWNDELAKRRSWFNENTSKFLERPAAGEIF